MDKETARQLARQGYSVEKQLGAGAFGVVYKAVKLGQPFAVKVIDLGKADSRSKSTYLPRELKALIGAKDEHLIHVYDVIRANRKMCIFMEFAGNGDIFSYARKNKGIREALACQWFYQVGSGLFFLHEKMLMAHRDIKLDNMLLDAKWVAKVSWDGACQT